MFVLKSEYARRKVIEGCQARIEAVLLLLLIVVSNDLDKSHLLPINICVDVSIKRECWFRLWKPSATLGTSA